MGLTHTRLQRVHLQQPAPRASEALKKVLLLSGQEIGSRELRQAGRSEPRFSGEETAVTGDRRTESPARLRGVSAWTDCRAQSLSSICAPGTHSGGTKEGRQQHRRGDEPGRPSSGRAPQQPGISRWSVEKPLHQHRRVGSEDSQLLGGRGEWPGSGRPCLRRAWQPQAASGRPAGRGSPWCLDGNCLSRGVGGVGGGGWGAAEGMVADGGWRPEAGPGSAGGSGHGPSPAAQAGPTWTAC